MKLLRLITFRPLFSTKQGVKSPLGFNKPRRRRMALVLSKRYYKLDSRGKMDKCDTTSIQKYLTFVLQPVLKLECV